MVASKPPLMAKPATSPYRPKPVSPYEKRNGAQPAFVTYGCPVFCQAAAASSASRDALTRSTQNALNPQLTGFLLWQAQNPPASPLASLANCPNSAPRSNSIGVKPLAPYFGSAVFPSICLSSSPNSASSSSRRRRAVPPPFFLHRFQELRPPPLGPSIVPVIRRYSSHRGTPLGPSLFQCRSGSRGGRSRCPIAR